MNTEDVLHRWPHRWYGLWRGFAYPDHELPAITDAIDLWWCPDDKSSLVAYLCASPGVCTSSQTYRCQFCQATLPQSYHKTDYVWLWNSDLAHYVAEHQVVLPDAFAGHIREQEHVPPAPCQVERWLLPWPESWTTARLPPS